MIPIPPYRGNEEAACNLVSSSNSKTEADEKAITAITWKEELEVHSVRTHASNETSKEQGENLVMHIWNGHLKEVQEILSQTPDLVDLLFSGSLVKSPNSPAGHIVCCSLQHLACHKRDATIAAYIHKLRPMQIFTPTPCNDRPIDIIADDTSQESGDFFSALLHTGLLDNSLFTSDPHISISHALAFSGNTRLLKVIFQRLFTPFSNGVRPIINQSYPFPKELVDIMVDYLPYDACMSLKERINFTARQGRGLISVNESHTLLSAARRGNAARRATLTAFLLQAGADPDTHIEMLNPEYKKVKISIRYLHVMACSYNPSGKAFQNEHIEFTQILEAYGKSIPSPSSISPERAVSVDDPVKPAKKNSKCVIQ